MTEETPQHVHHYVTKGSGLSCWAQCVCPIVGCLSCRHACGEKLNNGNGVVVGSAGKVRRAIEDAT
jgi:hypothetical protein